MNDFVSVGNNEIRVDTIKALRAADATPPEKIGGIEFGGHPPRVIVDFGSETNTNCIVVEFGSNQERDDYKSDLMNKIRQLLCVD